MDKPIEEFIRTVLGEGSSVVGSLMDSIKNFTNTSGEPDNIDAAIKYYEERIELLLDVKNKGFNTIAEYKKYQEAAELIAKHNAKMSHQ